MKPELRGYTPKEEQHEKFLNKIQQKIENDHLDDDAFFNQFSWEEINQALKLFNENYSNRTNSTINANEIIAELEAAKSHHFRKRIEHRANEKLLDKPIQLFRAVESSSDPTIGGVTWWTPDENAARKYAQKYTPSGSVYTLNITLESDKQMDWTVDRKINNPDKYTFGISYGNDAEDGGSYDPAFLSIGELFIGANGTIEKI